MRISSRYQGTSYRSLSGRTLGGLSLGLAFGLALVSSASPADAQQPKPGEAAPKQPTPKKPQKPAQKPAAAGTDQPAGAAPDAAAPAAAGQQPSTSVAAPSGAAVAGQPETGAAQPPASPPAGASPAGAPTTAPVTPATTPPAGKGEPLMPPTDAAAPSTGAVSPDPDSDARALQRQGSERSPGAAASSGQAASGAAMNGEIGAHASDVFAEDWWSHARPTFEMHGYYRLRAELFHKFGLGRRDTPQNQLWPQPPDNTYKDLTGAEHDVRLCGANPLALEPCENNTQAGANMRFRINPELHISDNLRVLSQVDMLDNLVLGSTPEGYVNRPSSGGYSVIERGGYSPTGAFARTQWAPVAGQNSFSDSIVVKRVWGEYLTPLGVLRFGRMPDHWGLGMLANGGDGYDSDWQSTADRIMFVTGFKQFDLYIAGAWDFANEGPISGSLTEQQGQRYDLGQLDDVSQYVFIAARKRDPELQKLDLARGDVVLNGGLYFTFRNQHLASDTSASGTSAALGESPDSVSQGYVRRGATSYIPDLWLQLLYKKFRLEVEAAVIYGSLENSLPTGSEPDYENPADDTDPGWKIRQFGIATQMEYRAVEDKLRLEMGFGYSTGDDDVDSLTPQGAGLDTQRSADRTFSTFRFHPDYRVDMILFRNILSRVQGAYYFRPSVEYDFSRNKNGQRLGGGAAAIWSRASEFVQAPGNKRDLGIELNAQIYYQSKDGAMNDEPGKLGGFYTSLQYGVLFPLGGLGHLPGEVSRYTAGSSTAVLGTETAQVLRWFLGVMF